MTKPSLSWIDRGRVSSLLSRMASPRPRSQSAPKSVSRTLAPPMLIEGPDGPQPGSFVPPPAPSMRAPALSPEAPEAPAFGEFSCPGGALEARLEAFVAWVEASLECETVFVADESGLPVVSHSDEMAMVAVTAPCMAVFDQAWRAMGSGRRGRLVLAIDDHKLLHVAETLTPWGRFGVAVIARSTVPDDIMQSIQRGLASALSEEETRP